MKHTIAALLLATIVMTGIMVAFISGVYTKYSFENSIEDNIDQLHDSLELVFGAFDNLVEREERQLIEKLRNDLPKFYKDLMADGIDLKDITEEQLHRINKKYGFTESYLLDRSGVIYTTTFQPDLGFNLNEISKGFSEWLSSMYGKGEVFTDRLILSTKTGILNIYGYYSPLGSDVIIDVSINIREHIKRLKSQEYVDFLFQKLFENAMQSASKIMDVDLYMYNNLAAWSVIHEGKALNNDILKRLETEPEFRIWLDDQLIVYTRFKPSMKRDYLFQEFCTKSVYDTSELTRIIRDFVIYTILSMCLIVPLIYFLTSRLITKKIITPIEDVVNTLHAIKNGEYSRKLEVKGVPEVELIARAVNEMEDEILLRQSELEHTRNVLEERVIERTKELEKARKKAEELARTDMLTGLPNRRAFRENGEHIFASAKRYKHSLSTMMVDIDYFKKVNDTYGHEAGDRVLVGIAEAIRESSREVDLSGRWGGEEFVFLLPATEKADAVILADRLRIQISKLKIKYKEKLISVTSSIGVAWLDDECGTLEMLLDRADIALYKAKESGRNQVKVHREKDFGDPAGNQTPINIC